MYVVGKYISTKSHMDGWMDGCTFFVQICRRTPYVVPPLIIVFLLPPTRRASFSSLIIIICFKIVVVVWTKLIYSPRICAQGIHVSV